MWLHDTKTRTDKLLTSTGPTRSRPPGRTWGPPPSAATSACGCRTCLQPEQHGCAWRPAQGSSTRQLDRSGSDSRLVAVLVLLCSHPELPPSFHVQKCLGQAMRSLLWHPHYAVAHAGSSAWRGGSRGPAPRCMAPGCPRTASALPAPAWTRPRRPSGTRHRPAAAAAQGSGGRGSSSSAAVCARQRRASRCVHGKAAWMKQGLTKPYST